MARRRSACWRGLDPKRTAVMLISKSFGTQETLLNGAILRDWLGDDARFYAVTANPDARGRGVRDSAGTNPADVGLGRRPLFAVVGGRPADCAGDRHATAFEQLLAGAAEMDAHVLDAPPRENLASWHALTAVWNRNGLGLAATRCCPTTSA